MSTRRVTTVNTTALYVIAVVIVVVAFLLLGGVSWMRGLSHMHVGRSMGIANWNWAQILISLGIGFLLGLLAGRRK